jgi:hypothetical protein
VKVEIQMDYLVVIKTLHHDNDCSAMAYGEKSSEEN